MADSSKVEQVDVLIVGAGFASYTLLHRLRKLGLSVKIYEKGSASGGIWYWNCYPGARVDSDTPIYQLFDKELWSEWTFSERYAGWKELREYFKFVDSKWKISEHITYNKHVDSASFDESSHSWLVETSDGEEIRAKWFLPCIGFASRRYTPPFPGLGNFRGDIYHSAVWPQHGVNLKGKRIALIGSGASGIQIAQEIGDQAKELTCYIRTPNYCLPMNQVKLDPKEEEAKKKDGTYERDIEQTRHTFAGFTYDFSEKNTFDDTPEDREKFFHRLLIEEGGFKYWLNTYKDMLFDLKANAEAYNFWRQSVLKRIKNPEKAKILAPETAPHPWGTKRPSLEQRYYEVMDQDHVKLINLQESKIEEVTDSGIRTSVEGLIDYDVIILATGFDSVTGSLAQLNIQGKSGSIADHWRDGTKTSMGIAMPGFPNMFFLYGPQAPTAFSNGPSCTQFQAEWVEKFMSQIQKEGITRVEPTEESETDWCRRMAEKWDASLFPLAKSWYQGSNIPGKKVEALNWSGGMVAYVDTLNSSLEKDYQGWHVEKGTKA